MSRLSSCLLLIGLLRGLVACGADDASLQTGQNTEVAGASGRGDGGFGASSGGEAGSGAGAFEGTGGSSAVGGGSSTSTKDPSTLACDACLRALCVNCPEGQASCDPCTVQPSLCGPSDSGAPERQCACQSCGNVCAGVMACSTEETEKAPTLSAGQGGSGGVPGGIGGFGGVDAGGCPEEEQPCDGMGNKAGEAGAANPSDKPETCFDGTDEDGDGLVDCDDTDNCQSYCGDPCLEPPLIALDTAGVALSFNGLWKGHANAFAPKCTAASKTGADIVYRVINKTPTAGFLRVQASSAAGNAVLSLRQGCSVGDGEMLCRDGTGNGGSEEIYVSMSAGQELFFAVGAATPKDVGSYQLSVELNVPECGDGELTPDEDCEPKLSEGCNSSCKITACEGAFPFNDGKTEKGSLAGAPSSEVIQPSCAKLGPGSPEHIYSIRSKYTGLMQAVVRSKGASDLTLSLLSSCQNSAELACSDRAPGNPGSVERLVVPVAEGQVMFAAVDTYEAKLDGDFDLFLRSYPALCGDSVVSPNEQCDGGKAGNDKCDELCTIKLTGSVLDEPNDLPELARVFEDGLGARIQPPGDVDWFRFTPDKDGATTVSVNAPENGSCWEGEFNVMPTGILDSELRLLNLDGELLASNDNAAGKGFCSALTFDAKKGQVYLLQVRASPASPDLVFAYRLGVTTP